MLWMPQRRNALQDGKDERKHILQFVLSGTDGFKHKRLGNLIQEIQKWKKPINKK